MTNDMARQDERLKQTFQHPPDILQRGCKGAQHRLRALGDGLRQRHGFPPPFGHKKRKKIIREKGVASNKKRKAKARAE